ncbi:helix-turn-helix domain-containing protein [Nocardia sp. NPDC047038]|uniref:PucR family transcriptional regulator n=1 Tax=Nocardia sp. NPDC047038 TaxID=3154338 RepID=UPI0033C71B3A
MSKRQALRGSVIEADASGNGPVRWPTDPEGVIAEIDLVAHEFVARFTAEVALPNGRADADGKARRCREHGPFTDGKADQLEEQAAGWARKGIPLDTALRIIHRALRGGIESAGERERSHRYGPSEPFGQDRADLRRGTTAMLDLLELLTSTISRGYLRELGEHPPSRRTAARALTSALLNGQATPELASRCGFELSAEYWVLALRIESTTSRLSSEMHRGTDRRTLAHRALLRLEAELVGRTDDRALPMLSIEGGLALLPTNFADDRLDSLFHAMAQAAGVRITTTVMRSPVSEIPACAEHARDLLDMVRRLGVTGTVHRFPDLALEYQLTRPGPGRTVLSSLLDPIDEYPELLLTLTCHVANGSNRRLTARMLHLHPNTIDSRLKRIAHLTGLDTAASDGLWRLRSALIARSYLTASSGSAASPIQSAQMPS